MVRFLFAGNSDNPIMRTPPLSNLKKLKEGLFYTGKKIPQEKKI